MDELLAAGELAAGQRDLDAEYQRLSRNMLPNVATPKPSGLTNMSLILHLNTLMPCLRRDGW
jgi:hypothetical protein